MTNTNYSVLPVINGEPSDDYLPDNQVTDSIINTIISETISKSVNPSFYVMKNDSEDFMSNSELMEELVFIGHYFND